MEHDVGGIGLPTARPSLNQHFERDGYVVVKGVFDAEQCSEMVEQVWRQMPDKFRTNEPETWNGRIEDCCNNLPIYQRNGLLRYKDKHGFRHDPVFARHIYSNGLLREAFEAVTGRSLGRLHVRGLHPVLPMPRWVSINEATGNRLDPQLERPEQSWPKIPCPSPLPILGHLDAHPIDVLMMIYLDKVEPNGGGLAVWPGSHRLLKLCFESLYDFLPTRAYRRAMKFLQRFRPLDLAAAQGDVIFFHNRLMHSNSVNTTKDIRQAVLVDAFSENWREREEAWRQDMAIEQRRLEIAATDDVSKLPEARWLTSKLSVDPRRAFWSAHGGLRALISEIGKDPIGKARRELSAKIRGRRDGDHWIVVSQDPSHRVSHKLDSYGVGSLGKYMLLINGACKAKSLSGVIVERIELQPGLNRVEIRGRFDTTHYVRVIRSRNPVEHSDILNSGTIPPKSGRHFVDIRMEADCCEHAREPSRWQ